MLLGLVFGFVLPLITAGLLLAGTFLATGTILRLARTWPQLHDRLVAVLALNSFTTTLVAFYVLFVLAIGFWYQFL
jgi:hypothetical protein